MRRRRVIIISALCVLVGVCVVAFWPGENEPQHDGMRLSEWLAVQGERPTEASDAIRAIGTNGLPILIRWAEYQVPVWRYRLVRHYSRLPRFLYSDALVNLLVNRKTQVRSFKSVYAFQVLGTNAFAAIPELSRFVTDPRNPDRKVAAQALASIGGKDALPPLLVAVQDKTTPDIRRATIAGAIPHLNYRGPELSNAVPVMIGCLQETNPFVPSLAASALGTFLIQPDQCVPALTRAIESLDYRVRRNAIRALGDFGLDATNAIAAISKALDDSEQVVRKEATNALEKIVPSNGHRD